MFTGTCTTPACNIAFHSDEFSVISGGQCNLLDVVVKGYATIHLKQSNVIRMETTSFIVIWMLQEERVIKTKRRRSDPVL